MLLLIFVSNRSWHWGSGSSWGLYASFPGDLDWDWNVSAELPLLECIEDWAVRLWGLGREGFLGRFGGLVKVTRFYCRELWAHLICMQLREETCQPQLYYSGIPRLESYEKLKTRGIFHVSGHLMKAGSCSLNDLGLHISCAHVFVARHAWGISWREACEIWETRIAPGCFAAWWRGNVLVDHYSLETLSYHSSFKLCRDMLTMQWRYNMSTATIIVYAWLLREVKAEEQFILNSSLIRHL